MTEKEYRASDGISRSELWQIRRSPERFIWLRENPEPPTQALIFGQVVHKTLLEPEKFCEEFAIAPIVDRRTKEGKAIYAEFIGNLEDRTAISKEDFAKAGAMVSAAMAAPFVAKLLDGEHEFPIRWYDDLTGELCKARLDCLKRMGNEFIIVDYKTTNDASTEAFMRSAINYGYDFQAAMYCEGVEKAFGSRPSFVFIAQEKEPPFSVNILKADEKFITHGYDTYRELLGIYHECKQTGNWYGYLGKDKEIGSLGLPPWILKEED